MDTIPKFALWDRVKFKNEYSGGFIVQRLYDFDTRLWLYGIKDTGGSCKLIEEGILEYAPDKG